MRKMKKIVASVIAFSLAVSMLTGCGKSGDSQKGGGDGTDTSKEVKLSMYLYGSAGPANGDILKEINKKLKADINATLEIKYIDWGDVGTKYPLLFASGEQFDLAYAGSNNPLPYSTVAKQEGIYDITKMLDTVAPKLKADIPENVWKSAYVDGKIYGIPTVYSEFTPTGFVTRRDFREKYGMGEVNSIETMEEYLTKATEAKDMVALNGNSLLAMDMYKMFVETTGSWMGPVPGVPASEMFLVSPSPEDYKNIFHPAFTQEFEDFAVKMREWSDKGFWTKDVLSSQQGGKDNFLNGLSASFITHMADWSGTYGEFVKKLPGVETDFWCFAEQNGKITRKLGVENMTVINKNSKNPERALMAVEKFMTDESYYNLLQYGLEGRSYVIKDGLITKPEGFDNEKDSGGFAAWALRSDKFNIPYDTEDKRRYELNEEWEKVAINSPYVGFSFDGSKVSTELAAISNVNAQLGIQIMLGKTKADPKVAVAEYRQKLKDAGIDKVIEEVKAQLENFTPIASN